MGLSVPRVPSRRRDILRALLQPRRRPERRRGRAICAADDPDAARKAAVAAAIARAKAKKAQAEAAQSKEQQE